ncbi:hypothetical protein LguiB_001741 [Lonicera macranthoides]
MYSKNRGISSLEMEWDISHRIRQANTGWVQVLECQGGENRVKGGTQDFHRHCLGG